jgi:Cu-Zn family superoxide dismutase
MTRFAAFAVVAAVTLLAVAAAQDQQSRTSSQATAVAVLQAASESEVSGTIKFVAQGDHVQITGEVRGLTPGEHGFHIHEFGDISAMDGGSAGGHFNPTNQPHGGREDAQRHVGDLGNIKANDQGVATINLRDKHIKLSGPHSIVGRAVVVHAKADDLKSQPSGDAGARVGVGVVGIGNSQMGQK